MSRANIKETLFMLEEAANEPLKRIHKQFDLKMKSMLKLMLKASWI